MAAVGDKYGPYTCVRRIGEGGMAETFLANQSGPYGFEQRVCIKLIREDCRNRPKFVEMFFQEATIAASLRHSNIVSVIDASQEDGYMVLELVDGVDLRTLLQEMPGKRLAPDYVTFIALELVKALDFAHNRRLRGKADGIVHRDIKPSNVLVSYAGEVKLADFGIAKAIRSTLESDGLIRGTPYYMSPEQVQGQPMDQRSDLFSLGIVLYELLAGQHPFIGQNDVDTTRRICTGEFTPLSESAYTVPAGLAVVIERLLRPDPKERFESAQALGETLDRFAPPPSIYRKLGHLARKARLPETLLPADETGLPAMIQPVSQASTEEIARSDSNFEVAPDEVARAFSQEPIPAGPNQPTRTAVFRQPSPAPTQRIGSIRNRSSSTWNSKARFFFAASLAAIVGATVLVIMANSRKTIAKEKGPESRVIQTVVTATPHPSVTPTTNAVPVRQAPSPDKSDKTADLPSDLIDKGSSEQTVSNPASSSSPESSVTTASKRPTAEIATSQEKGVVRIGVFPWGKVWIDDRYWGSAPVSAELFPGKHVIAGGVEKPIVSKTVKLKAGSIEQVVINLNNEDTHRPGH
jgi:eukaryotic-like serine/threonine-protein kinase